MQRTSTQSKTDQDDLSHASYWDLRYQSALGREAPAAAPPSSSDDPDGQAAKAASLPSGSDGLHEQPDHEWFRSPDTLVPFLSRHLIEPYPSSQSHTVQSRPQSQSQSQCEPHILHLGPGTSYLPHTLHRPPYSYHSQTAIDFSPTLIHHQRTLNSLYTSLVPPITWIEGDVRNMPQIATGSVDVAIDKGTLDAMIDGCDLWDPKPEVRGGVRRYLAEVGRVLRDGEASWEDTGGMGKSGDGGDNAEIQPTRRAGSMLYITYRQPHFIKPLLALQNWAPADEIVVEELEGEGGSFGYFGYVLKKKKGNNSITQEGPR